MARPLKGGGDKRESIIRVRFTAAEKIQIQKAASSRGLTVSDFIRVLAINASPLFRKATPERAAFIKGLAELGKIGSNLNQIARAINRKQAGAGGSEELRGVDASLIQNALHGVNTLSAHLAKQFSDGD
jgi:uncharacterized protein (DUF1778 family)